jgi:hypothetical protein
MTTQQYLGYATQLLQDLGLFGAITAMAVIGLAIWAYQRLTNRGGA